MQKFSRKMLSIMLAFVLVLGIFSVVLPSTNLMQLTKAESSEKTYDYMEVLNGVTNDTGINDTRVWGVSGTDFGSNGLKSLGIWNAMGLDVAWGALGISHNFFDGTAVGAERDEIHPYIVYNVTPGTSFELSSAIHAKNSKESESVLSFYVSNDGATWIPIDAERNSEGVWKSKVETWNSYDSYVYTIKNVGLKTNFVKVEYPMTMASRDDGSEPSSNLVVYGVKFTPVANYAVNGQTLFEATSFARQKEFYEEHFIAYPDFVNMDTSVSDSTAAATSNYGMLQNSTWGDFELKDRSYVAMVAPGSHFYLETANNWYMKSLGETLVAKGKLESADKARIRVYSSATLLDDLSTWTEWEPMPYSCQSNHIPTFNFYLPKDHIYVRIVYPQEGKISSLDGFPYDNVNGNDAAFFNDMVFTPYKAADADDIYDYTSAAYWSEPQAGTSNLSQNTDNGYGVTIPWTNAKNLVNDAAQNTEAPFAKGHFSIQYAVEGGKMFNLEYAVRVGNYGGSAGDGNTKGNYEANVTDGSSMELIIESSTDNANWTNAYETESGYAKTTNSYNGCCTYDVSYLVPKNAKFVRVSFGITGVGYLKDNSTYQGFNDCLYIRKVSIANANNVYVAPAQDSSSGPVEYIYTTDTDGSKATSTSKAPTGSIGNFTGFMGDYGYLIGGDGANPKMLAGTLDRAYVVYDVVPGSDFSFDFAMRKKAIEMAKTSAALNVKGGLGKTGLAEFEFFVYGRNKAESETWTYIGKTNSDNLTLWDSNNNYDTFGSGSLGVTIPNSFDQVKIELPQTGAFVTNGDTLKTYDYTSAFYADSNNWSGNNIGAWNYSHIGIVGASSDQVCYEPVVSGLTSAWNQSAWDTKDFYLIYKVKPGSTFVADVKLPDTAKRQDWKNQGVDFEFIVSSCATIDGTYGNAKTTEGLGADAVIGYQVPAGCEYVKITFPNKGTHPITSGAENHNAYIKAVRFYDSGASFAAGNDAAYLYNVKYASEAKGVVEYAYTTDTDGSKAISTGNTETASIDGATGFRGGWGYLAGGDGNNPKTLAGTLERPYVIYDVVPGSDFSFDYSMYVRAKAASEATAALNINGGLGNESLKEYEFFVYGRADEDSSWTYIGKTDSAALDCRGGDPANYGTNGYGKGNFTVPAGVNQVKVELPGTGAFTTATPVVWDYTAMSGDFGGWNANGVGGYASNAAGDVMVCVNGKGLTINYAANYQKAWGEANLYVIYKVARGTTFVATTNMPSASTRNSYAEKTDEPFEFKLQYSVDNSNWSEAVTTAGQGTNGVLALTVPATSEYSEYYVKLSFPQKGLIPVLNYLANDNTYLTGVSFYNPGAWITAGNDAAHLYNVKYATGKKSGPDVNYTKLESSNIASADKKALNFYHHGGVSVVKGEGVKANSDSSFVIYKIKENTILTVNSNDALSFEYSVDDSDYKPVKAVKTCKGYEIPAITGRNYVKVKLDGGEAITNAFAETLAPTAKFYVPYLNKYELVDYADYGAAANSVSHTISTLRPGYTFENWSGYDDEAVYIDTVYEAVFVKSNELSFTVDWTVEGETQTKTNVRFDDRITISAATTNSKGQVFTKWVDAKGVTVSNSATFSFLASGDISLTAVYGQSKEDLKPYIYATEEPIITTNANGSWNLSVIWRTAMPEGVTALETGILLGANVEKASLVLWDGKTQSGTVKLKHNNTSTNKTAMYTVKNIKADAVRTALPFARLSNGEIIYANNVIKADASGKIDSAFEFNGSLSPTVLNNYLDRAISYDVFGTADGQSRDSAVYNAKDLLRQTGAKYLARGMGQWIPTSTDIYGDNFTTYKNLIAELHEMDPEVIVEACIFETCSSATDSLRIPEWVLEEFGQTVESNRYFSSSKMKHTIKKSTLSSKIFGEDQWGSGIHVPSISQVETQMFIYYRACQFIDMGIEAIHFGQMKLVGAKSTNITGDVSSIDNAAWTKVIDKINAYARQHARRGYLIVNGHNEEQKIVRSDNSNQMLVDFNMFPIRLVVADGATNIAAKDGFQAVKLNTSSNAPYAKNVVTGMTTPSGYKIDGSYPYLLEFDNYGVNTSTLDKARNNSFCFWGYDEISWYVNQNATDRRAFLTTISQTIKNQSAANGHVALPGKRTAFISKTGASEYLTNEANIHNGHIFSDYYQNGTGTYGTYGAQIPLWDIHVAGDVQAVYNAWKAIGAYDVKAE